MVTITAAARIMYPHDALADDVYAPVGEKLAVAAPPVTKRSEPRARLPQSNPVSEPGSRPRVFHRRRAGTRRAGFVS